MKWNLSMSGKIAAIEECVSKKGNKYTVILFLQGTKSKQVMVAAGSEKQFADLVGKGDVTVNFELTESYKYGNNFTAVSATLN